MFNKLQTVVFLSFLGIVLISFIVFGLFAAPSVKKAAINQTLHELDKQALLMRDDLSGELIQGKINQVSQNKVVRLSRLSGSRITLIRPDGAVIADSDTPYNSLSKMENHGDRPEIVQAKTGRIGQAVRYSTTLGKDLIYLALPVEKKGFVRVALPATYAGHLAVNIQRSVLIALLMAIVLAILLSSFFAQYYAKPVARLSAVAKQIAEGDFPQTIMRKSRFELRELEDSVEQMSKKLTDTFNKLARERGQMSAILDGMDEAVIAVDHSRKIILINPAAERLFGVVQLEIVGRTLREGLRNNEIAELVEKAREQDGKVEEEITIISPALKNFAAHAAPIKSDQGEVLGIVCVLHDITEIRKLENYRSEFVANVSHELKTPLTAIRNYTETLLSGGLEDEKRNREFVQKVDKHTVSLSALIDDLLEISRLESRREQTPQANVDLCDIVHRAVEVISSRAKTKEILVEAKYPDNKLIVSGIEDHLYRAILNLLDNAVNYTDRGGKVMVNCRQTDGQIELSVKDTGIGIAAEHLPRVFERFYRVDKARSRELGGTGLGLAIVKHIMGLHGGSVTVESQVGRGSVFTLTFPA